MPRRSGIRWRKSDQEDIANAVRQFNAKITRALKKNPELSVFLPSRITTSVVKGKVKTRSDLKRELNSLKRFLKKGAEAPVQSSRGVKTTKWEKKEIGIKVGTINRARNREAKKANVSTTKGTMGSIESNNLKPKSYNFDHMNPREWEKYVQTIEKQIMSSYHVEKMNQYKRNYLNSIRGNLGNGEYANRLYDLVVTLDTEFMYDIYYDDPVLQIQFTSDPLPAEYIAEMSYEHWQKALGNDID